MKNNLIKGIPASPGIAIGKAFLYKENNLEIEKNGFCMELKKIQN